LIHIWRKISFYEDNITFILFNNEKIEEKFESVFSKMNSKGIALEKSFRKLDFMCQSDKAKTLKFLLYLQGPF